MPRIDMCHDGIAMALVNEEGIWFVLQRDDVEFARFATDISEVRGVLDGRLTLQFTDGKGNGVAVEGGEKGLKIRLEGDGNAPKNCRIPREAVEKIGGTLNLDV